MKKIQMTVYKSESYDVELTDQEYEMYMQDANALYEFVCDNGIEPCDFGVDDISLEVV